MLILGSCTYGIIEEPEIEIPEEPISYVDSVEPVFTEANCIMCHNGGAQKPDLRVGYSYTSIMSNADLTSYDYAKNIYDYPKPSGAHNNRYTEDQATLVKIWIDQGTLDN